MTAAVVRRGARVAGAAIVIALAVAPAAAAAQANVEALFQEGRRLFDALDYESAVRALDQAIVGLEALAPRDAATIERLATAYEMRARSKFGLGNPDSAKADFVALLRVSPAYALTGQVSPRVVSLFEETVAEMITTVNLSVTPATAAVTVDGVAVTPAAAVKVVVGDHELAVEQRGYRAVKQAFTARAGEAADITVTLERVSAVLHILTSPPDVEITIDGKPHGRTAAGPPSAQYADAVTKSGLAPSAVSGALVVGDVAPGAHTIEFVRDCYVRAANPFSIEQPDDIVLGPVALQPAMAHLTVNANEPATVVVDGVERGPAPYVTGELCAGDHTIELRSRFGRDARRITAAAGEKLVVEGVIKPRFALVSFSSEAGAPDNDVSAVVERALAPAQTLTVAAAAAGESDKALKGLQLPAAWLAVDPEGRPLGAGAQMTPPLRAAASAKLAEALGAQGVASITMLERNRLTIALLAAGSAVPDVLDVRLDRPESIAAAIARVDRLPTFVQPSLGLTAIDVADVRGAVVAVVDANGPAAAASVQPGDVIVSAGGQPVADASALASLVGTHAADPPMALELRDARGATRTVSVDVFLAPRLIGLADQELMVNRVLVYLRARLAAVTDPFEQSVIRLNTAVALGRSGDWNGARELLKQIDLPDRPGVGMGTVQYLRGVAAQELGDRAAAEAAFRAAAASPHLMSEDGPPVRELAEARLAQLTKPGA